MSDCFVGAELVVQRMQLVPRATNINLGHNPLGDGGLSLITEHLCLDQHKNCVQELNLNNCGISDWGLILLSKYIENNTSLRRLFLMGVSVCFPHPVQYLITLAFGSRTYSSARATSYRGLHLR